MEGVGGQLRRVALGRNEATDCLIDGFYIDQSRLENGRAIDHLGNGGGGCAGGAAALGVEGNRADAAKQIYEA